MGYVGKPHSASQSSIFNPGTRLYSFALCVTTINPLARAMAAISISCGPMGVPRLSQISANDAVLRCRIVVKWQAINTLEEFFLFGS